MNFNKKYYWLDLARGIAALLVVLGHVRALTLIPYGKLDNPSLIVQIVYFLSGFGPRAVIVFFVLSGFLITKSIDTARNNGNFTLLQYLISRWTRLSVVLIPALVIGFVFDYSGLVFLSETPFYASKISVLPGTNLINSMSFNIFVGNIFYLQGLVVPSFGSNGPLWSLSFEWWFYIMAPLLLIPLLAIVKETRLLKNELWYLISLIVVIGFLKIVNDRVLLYFVIWLMGSATYFLLKKEIKFKISKTKVTLSLLMVAVTMSIGRLDLTGYIFSDFIIGLSVAYMVFILVQVKQIDQNKVIDLMANNSYSLYVFHFPMAAFLSSFMGFYDLMPSILNLLFYILFCALLFLISYGLWYLFERNTGIIKNMINDAITNLKPDS